MSLVRLDSASFAALERQWKEQCVGFGESYDDYASERVVHARNICNEGSPDPRYGIYALKDESSFEALIHVNRANIPGPPGWTLRMLWTLYAPKFDFEEAEFSVVAKLFSEIISEAISISKAEMECKHLKIHLGNLSDRHFFAGVASGLKMNKLFSDVRLTGNWFYLSHA